jgi:hypothetical protein
MPVVRGEVMGKIMSDMARAAANDKTWQPSLRFLDYLDKAFDQEFAKKPDQCDKHAAD